MPNCLECKISLKDYRSKRCRKCKARLQMTGIKLPIATRLKISQSNKGKHTYWLGKRMSQKHRKKMSESAQKVVAEGRHNFWKDGLDKNKHSKRYAQMRTFKYRFWRRSVFERDNYSCQNCGQYSGYLEADHIKPWNLYPNLRYSIANGRTLCRKCHIKTPTWGWGSAHTERVVI